MPTTIQEAVQAAAPGDIVKIPAGVYDVSDLVLPSNITLQADGNATIVGILHVNGSNTVVQGFTFDGGMVDVGNCQGATVRDCVFNDCVPHSDNGSAIALNDASGVVIENNVFNRCQGVTLGNYNYDRVTIDHNTFTDCSQVLSLWSFSPASGNDIKFTNNYVSGEGRGGIETGGDGQYLTNLLVDGNTFSNLKGPAEIGPISVVARGDAVASDPTHHVQADMLVGYYHIDPKTKQKKMYQDEATGHVAIENNGSVAHADKTVYALDSEIATLEGNVNITRGKNQLNGDHVVYNTKTGRARVTGSKGHVKTLLLPGSGGPAGGDGCGWIPVGIISCSLGSDGRCAVGAFWVWWTPFPSPQRK